MADNKRERHWLDPRRWLQFRIRTLLILTLIVGLGLFAKSQWDWRQRVQEINEWLTGNISTAASPFTPNIGSAEYQTWAENNTVYAVPTGLSKQEQLEGLIFGACNLPEEVKRTVAIKLIVEEYPDDRPKVLRRIIPQTRYDDTRALAMRLLSFDRSWDDVDLLTTLLDHKSVDVRSAAMEGIGIIRLPSYKLPVGTWPPGGKLPWGTDTQPKINVSQFSTATYYELQPDPLRLQVEHERLTKLRARISDVMLQADDPAERFAAARTLVVWPPDKYKLRVAEWGVWIDVEGELKLVQSIIDEIPPFVHRLGETQEPLQERIAPQIFIVTKPIIHVTADQPMSVDISVRIVDGRAWFAYPMPDDYSLLTGWQVRKFSRAVASHDFVAERFESLRDESFPPFKNSAGYPWLLPKSDLAQRGTAMAMGVRWQSLIVSPNKLPWMKLPAVENVPQFAWWKSLRDVPASYVSNRGETERFLYYDGPTRAKTPFIRRDDRDQNRLLIRQELVQGEALIDDALLIEVDDGVRVTHIPLAGEITEVGVALADQSRDDPEAVMRTTIERLGLSPEEAAGLVRCWKPQWLQTPGRRLLVCFDPRLYDLMCPINIRPTPTSTARVGIIMTELNSD